MAEALGIAGSVIGIISSGIQIAQGFLKYYRAWKDQDDDVSNTCASLDNLSGTLTILLETIQPREKFGPSVKNSVEKSINKFDGALKKLQSELKNVQDAESPKLGVRSTMRRHVRRALYPFKEDTLSKIQGVVSEARSNLALALQVLQVDNVSDIRRQVNLIVRWQEDEETRRIIDWLSPVNFWLKQADVYKQRQSGTGQWLLEHSDFLEWERGNKQAVWCRGSPGVGKTVLASAVVKFLENDLPIPNIGLTFTYCNHKEKKSQSVEHFLGAIARQLVEQRQAVPKDVRILHEKYCGKRTSPTRAEYLELLQSLAKECAEVYLVIDALDECIDDTGNSIWSNLLTQLKGSVPNLRLLCTSRYIDDIRGILTGSTRIEIRASDADIKFHVQAQVKSKDRLLQFCEQDTTLQNEILQVVGSKAEGMFLAAQLHVESLASTHNLRAVRKALHRLPENLDDIYREAMTRIEQQSEEDKQLALRVLSWIVYAVRPLQLAEVQHAIAVDDLEPEDQSISEDSLTPQSIIVNVCAGMIRVDEESNVTGLVHYTTQEYFDRNGSKHFPDAQRDIGIACLKYLSLDVFSEGYCSTDELYERRLRENTLLDYAARNLANHIREETEQSLYDLALKFLLDERKVSCASQVLFVIYLRWTSEYSQQFPKNFQGVHYAAYFGLTDMIELLFENLNVDPNSEDTYGRTPLSWAAENGHEKVVRLLLAIDGVNPDSKDTHRRTPLSWAAETGQETIVRLLLAMDGVDPDSKDTHRRTPLSWAAENGHEVVVRLLLATDDVDPNFKDDFGGQTPLSWAAENGHEMVVRLLLAMKGVNRDSKDNHNRTPLSRAAENGHETLVRLLLATDGIDADSRGGFTSQTPLSWAAENGHEAVVRLLLETDGVNRDSKNYDGQTPLSRAAKNGHETVVRLLLKTDGIDPNSKSEYSGQTPLSWATQNGHEAVVRLLLATDSVSRDPKDNYGRTPLSLAMKNRHETIVRLLLATGGVDPNFKDDLGGLTPLLWAAKNGHEAVVKLLLATDGVNWDSKDNHGRTPLSWAVGNGHEAVVRLLQPQQPISLDYFSAQSSPPHLLPDADLYILKEADRRQ